jgi:hypothetical protein
MGLYALARKLHENAVLQDRFPSLHTLLEGALTVPVIEVRPEQIQTFAAQAAEFGAGQWEERLKATAEHLPWPRVTVALPAEAIFVQYQDPKPFLTDMHSPQEADLQFLLLSHHIISPGEEQQRGIVVAIHAGVQFRGQEYVTRAFSKAFLVPNSAGYSRTKYCSEGYSIKDMDKIQNQLMTTGLDTDWEVIRRDTDTIQDHGFTRALLVLSYINRPDRCLVERTERKRKPGKSRKSRKSGPQASRHILIPRDVVVSEYRSAHPGIKKMPHFRRGHWRTLRAERYGEKRGTRIWVRPTQVGEPDITWAGRPRVMRVAYSRGVFRLREQFISDQAAQAAYDVVTNNCGAPVHARNPCAFHFTRWNGRAPTEFRFQGDLGFGGKLYLSRARGFYVDTYPEDRTRSRAAAIEAANAELASINTRFPWYSVEAVPGRLG